MEIRHEQNLEQSLQLLLSPKLLAMLRVLALPYIEMVDEIKRECEENPLLEVERADTLAEYLRYLGTDKKAKKQLDLAEYPGMENVKDIAHNLTEHLLEQLKLVNLPPEVLKAGEFLIENLEPNGYLKNYQELKPQAVSKLGVDEGAVDRALAVIQTFEPEGVGARDLKECLLIQVREYNFESEELQDILTRTIENHLDDLADRNFGKIAKALKISESGVAEIANYIKENLNFNPASGFSEEVRRIIPSFAIEIDGKGAAVGTNLEEKYGPKIKISTEYEKILKDPKTDAQTVKFLKEKMERVKDLMETMARRQGTIDEILKIITETQQDFVKKGPAHLKPLMQKDLAEMIGVHPSTISRALAEKYVQTPRGLFPAKFLCPREVSGSTPERIRSIMLETITDEDKRHPVSDEELKELLAKSGVAIERRTVAAYRKQLGILPASERHNL
ncbi:MAG: RNA polymerase factor sigma-54 [Candidatus Margulisiibacteriota bacterium]